LPTPIRGVFCIWENTLKHIKVDTLSYKTVSANKATVQKEWVLVDATDQSLGRLSSRIAMILRGKHKASFTPHVDCGDNVVVINAEKVKFTGMKFTDRLHFRHSGYPGGQTRETPEAIFKKNPCRIIENSVRGMLPRNRLGARLFTNLHVFVGSDHKHQAQNPKTIDLNTIK
jgi:large subunit ribosomal protein L13